MSIVQKFCFFIISLNKDIISFGHGYKFPITFPYFRHAAIFMYTVFMNSVYVLVDNIFILTFTWCMDSTPGPCKRSNEQTFTYEGKTDSKCFLSVCC